MSIFKRWAIIRWYVLLFSSFSKLKFKLLCLESEAHWYNSQEFKKKAEKFQSELGQKLALTHRTPKTPALISTASEKIIAVKHPHRALLEKSALKRWCSALIEFFPKIEFPCWSELNQISSEFQVMYSVESKLKQRWSAVIICESKLISTEFLVENCSD